MPAKTQYPEILQVRVRTKTKRNIEEFIDKINENNNSISVYKLADFLREAIEEKLKGYRAIEKVFSDSNLMDKFQQVSPEDFHDFVLIEWKNNEILSELVQLAKDPTYKLQISEEEIQKAIQRTNTIAQKMNKEEMKKLIEEDEEIQEIIVRRMVKTFKPLSKEVKKEFLKALNRVE